MKDNNKQQLTIDKQKGRQRKKKRSEGRAFP